VIMIPSKMAEWSNRSRHVIQTKAALSNQVSHLICAASAGGGFEFPSQLRYEKGISKETFFQEDEKAESTASSDASDGSGPGSRADLAPMEEDGTTSVTVFVGAVSSALPLSSPWSFSTNPQRLFYLHSTNTRASATVCVNFFHPYNE
jgi:hypothetical protein